jgi:hypothetical protein
MPENFKDYALFAAIFAALISSLATWMLAHRQRSIEHHQWLRNRKQEAYVKFWDARREFLNVAQRESDPLRRATRREELLKELRPTTIRMLAPKKIAELAYEIYEDTKDLIGDDGSEAHPDSQIGQMRARIKENSRQLMGLIIGDVRSVPGLWTGLKTKLATWTRFLSRAGGNI